jgi:predicted Zn-dependent peptidase
MFRELQEIDAVSKGDIRRVAQLTFVEGNRTVASIEFKAPAPPPGATPPPAAAGKGGAR